MVCKQAILNNSNCNKNAQQSRNLAGNMFGTNTRVMFNLVQFLLCKYYLMVVSLLMAWNIILTTHDLQICVRNKDIGEIKSDIRRELAFWASYVRNIFYSSRVAMKMLWLCSYWCKILLNYIVRGHFEPCLCFYLPIAKKK